MLVKYPTADTGMDRPLSASQVYARFMEGSIEVPGSDVCDMSGAEGRTRDQFTVHNVMLPRTYYPAWQGSIFEQRCQV